MSTQPDVHNLLAAAVQAKMSYWDALRELEKATAPNNEEWSDRANDAVIDWIDLAASGMGAVAVTTDDDVAAVMKLAQKS